MKRKIGKALVVGAGISGIRTALDLAETGYHVTLMDRSPHLGGILSQLDYQFPTDRCGMCKMLPHTDRDAGSEYCLRRGLFHENIEILLSSTLISVDGDPGKYEVVIKQKPQLIDPEKCTGCGECARVCPVEIGDDFNAGLTNKKAVYLPVPHMIPNGYTIDPEACTRCGECEKACPTGAIRLRHGDREGFHILVVDDEQIVRDSLQAWLADEEGFSVDTASSGAEALEKLTTHPYQLMLLDIKMPGMDGVEVLEKAKNILPDLPVVMMTAYATVETAVEAMKIGAMDYLIKPFDTDVLIPKVTGIYETFEIANARTIEVGAIALCGGASYFDPSEGKNPFGYGALPNVVTSIEFERILSGTGPGNGALVRPSDGKPIKRAAWLQCVGSRDLQLNADYCSSICCMFAVKEAVISKKRGGDAFTAAIFYMDMRTPGKHFQRYRDRAEQEHGVDFIRGRVHSLITDPATGGLVIQWVDPSGNRVDEVFDMVILSTGQRPSVETEALAEATGLEASQNGFIPTLPFSLTRTEKEGIVVGGSFSGLKDISDSVTCSSAAAVEASRIIHQSGGGLAVHEKEEPPYHDVSMEQPKIGVVICQCGHSAVAPEDVDQIKTRLTAIPDVDQVEFLEGTCTSSGWERLAAFVKETTPNRLLIGTCLPHLYADKLNALCHEVGLDPVLMEVVNMGTNTVVGFNAVMSTLLAGIAKLRKANPVQMPGVSVVQRALVVGGGIAGMQAAISIADHGIEVDIIEKSDSLGGNLIWLNQTLEGHPMKPLLDETVTAVDKHPNINVMTRTRVAGAYGRTGCFFTTCETDDASETQTINHGAVILATGGSEALPQSVDPGENSGIITQMALEKKIAEEADDLSGLSSVVMIQCVDQREEPRNYCSRVCCSTSLKHALWLKKMNPDTHVYILYRDMMTCGFEEKWYTKARKAGIIFIQYKLDQKPSVKAGTDASDTALVVNAHDPVLDAPVEIVADLVVLATGIVPDLPDELAGAYGIQKDQDGFFKEADSKWRPVDALKQGVFGCGLSHSPRSVPESITGARAAAMQAVKFLGRPFFPAGRLTSSVHHSLCAVCELCIDTCPYEARFLDETGEKVLVNAAMCQGCGACAAVCPSGAAVLEGLSRPQMLDMIDAAFA